MGAGETIIFVILNATLAAEWTVDWRGLVKGDE